MGEGRLWEKIFRGGKTEPKAAETLSPEVLIEKAEEKLRWLEAYMAAPDRHSDGGEIVNIENALLAIFKVAEGNAHIMEKLKKIVADSDKFDKCEEEGTSSDVHTGDWQETYYTDAGTIGVVHRIRDWLESKENEK